MPMSNRMSKSADVLPAAPADVAQVGASAGMGASAQVGNSIGTQAGMPVPSAGPPSVGAPPRLPKEIGGPPGPEPTRYGDWQYKGRCTDF